jgi:hypothetical protein
MPYVARSQTILPLMIDQGYARDVLPSLLRALNSFRQVDREFATVIRYYLGLAHYQLAEYDRAREYLTIALTGFQEQRFVGGQAMVLALLWPPPTPRCRRDIWPRWPPMWLPALQSIEFGCRC